MEKDLRKKEGVYVVHVTNEDVDYVYIGSGKLGDRISGNASKLRRGVHANKQLQEQFNIVKDLKIEILDVCKNKKEARESENEYIDYFKKIDGVIVCNVYEAVNIEKEYEIKLDKDKVIEIRKMLDQKIKQDKIAELFGVTQPEISKIKNGKKWVNITVDNEKEVPVTAITNTSNTCASVNAQTNLN